MEQSVRGQHYDEMYKIVFLGDPNVGKSNILAHYISPDIGFTAEGTTKSFNQRRKPTVGVEFASKIVTHPDGTRIKAQIWDTAGQERYRAITASHYRRASGAIIVYDVTRRDTFDHAQDYWLSELQRCSEADNLLDCVAFVGNKIDLKEEVSKFEHENAVNELSLAISGRTSARTGEGITQTIDSLICRVHEMNAYGGHREPKNTLKSISLSAKPKQEPCC